MMPPHTFTAYDMLGVAPDATASQIERAWLRLRTLSHPDAKLKVGAEFFAALDRAKDLLLNHREWYDETLRSPAASPEPVPEPVPPNGFQLPIGGFPMPIPTDLQTARQLLIHLVQQHGQGVLQNFANSQFAKWMGGQQ